MKKMIGVIVLTTGLIGASNVYAILPVTDVAAITAIGVSSSAITGAISANTGVNTAGFADNAATTSAGWVQDMTNFVETKVKWVEDKLEAFKTETVLGQSLMTAMDGVDKLKTQINKLDGIRDNAKLALSNRLDPNNQVLPYDYTEGLNKFQANMNTGGGTAGALNTFQNIVLSITDSVGLTSDNFMDEDTARASYNRALAETAYRQAGDRRADVVAGQIAIENATEAKDIQDAQARMAGLQLDTLNEQIRVQSLILMTSAQDAVQRQKSKQQRLLTMEVTPKSMLVSAVAAGVAWNI